jgi:calcium/calmodulin-dependent protein kinase I
MEILRVRIEYFQNEGVSNHEFGIKFIKNLRFFNIYASNLEKRNEWRTAFSKHFIQSDFHTKFKVLKVIGKGGFAKVYLVEENEKPLNQFAVKAFSKDFILSQSTGRVLNSLQTF